MHRILVADDDPSLRLALSIILTDSGFTVTEAPDGREAWERFQRFNPNLLITDLEMPEMDGESLIETIKSRDLNFPIILMTGQKPSGRFLKLLRFPRVMILRKPLDETVLLESVELVRGLPSCVKHERSTARVPLNFEVKIDKLGKGRTGNLSTGGAFIEADRVPPVGTRLSLTIQACAQRISTRGVVAWVADRGFGLRFEALAKETSAHLEALIIQHLEISHPLCVAGFQCNVD